MATKKKAVGKPWDVVFEWVKISELEIDGTYQRDETKSTIAKIAKDLDPRKFGAIIVGVRKNKRKFVIDGQQRLAAAIIAEMTEVPAMVFEVACIGDEARVYSGMNKDRKALSAVDRFKADVVAKDDIALHIKDVVESTGYLIKLGSARNTVACVNALEICCKRDRDTFDGVWRLMAEVYGGLPVIDLILKGVFRLEMHLRSLGEPSLCSGKNRRDLITLGPDGLKKAIHASIGYHESKSVVIYADGIAKSLNKKRRTNRVSSPITENE